MTWFIIEEYKKNEKSFSFSTDNTTGHYEQNRSFLRLRLGLKQC